MLLTIFTASIQAQDYETHFNSGLEQLKAKNLIKAHEEFQQCLKIKPDAYAYYKSGRSKLQMNDVNACADFKKAEELGFQSDKKNPSLTKFYCDRHPSLNDRYVNIYKKRGLTVDNHYEWHYSEADSLRGALRKERTCYDVSFYDLRVKIVPEEKAISGSNSIHFTVMESTNKIQIDLFENMQIQSIRWKDADLKFQRKCNAVFIHFPETLNRGHNHAITVSYSGQPMMAKDPPWDGGFVWGKKNWTGVACEQLGASMWWPNKDHLSDEPDSMNITIIAPENLKAICNGNLRSVIQSGDGYAAHTWHVSNPINNYNVTFYLGDYMNLVDTFTNKSGVHRIDYYVRPKNFKKAQSHFKQTLEVLKVYEDLFGEYPFWDDGFALVEAPYEGMEHQGAIAYGSGYGKDKNNSYDAIDYDYIIVHEAAHEWWGNSVSVADMADIWMHEGFATYSELLLIERLAGKQAYLDEASFQTILIRNLFPVIGNRNVNDDAFVTQDVYGKGAMVLHNLRCTMDNDSLFFKILKDFAVQNKYKIVDSDMFVQFVNSSTHEDYTAFFDKFLRSADLPVLQYKYIRNGKDVDFEFRWTGVAADFEMPFALVANENSSLRLVATTEFQKVHLKDAEDFKLLNRNTGAKGATKNSFTYFWTEMLGTE